MRAVWNGVTIAESDDTLVVEGNHYFPRASFATTSSAVRHPHPLPVEGHRLVLLPRARRQQSKDAAWYYPEPKAAAKQITGRVAFWKDVEVTQ